jgi:hypothetical protein
LNDFASEYLLVMRQDMVFFHFRSVYHANLFPNTLFSWIRSLLMPNDDVAYVTTVSAQQQRQLKAPPQFLNHEMKLIKEYLPLVRSGLIFNVDECGFSDGEERMNQSAIIRLEARASTLHDRVNRKVRHQSLICCVAAAGDAYYLFSVTNDLSVACIFGHGV